MTITLKRRFAGSYFVAENDNINIESMAQFTGEYDVDDDGNRWVSSVIGDDDHTGRFKTKREAVADAQAIYDYLKNK